MITFAKNRRSVQFIYETTKSGCNHLGFAGTHFFEKRKTKGDVAQSFATVLYRIIGIYYKKIQLYNQLKVTRKCQFKKVIKLLVFDNVCTDAEISSNFAC
jgi:hypothetical protein